MVDADRVATMLRVLFDFVVDDVARSASIILISAADFINARPRGDTKLMWLRLRSISSVSTMLTTRYTPAALA